MSQRMLLICTVLITGEPSRPAGCGPDFTSCVHTNYLMSPVSQNIEFRDRVAQCGAQKNVRREMREGGNSGKTDRSSQPVCYPGNPAMFAIALRDHRGN